MPVSDSFAGSSGTGTLDIALTSQEGDQPHHRRLRRGVRQRAVGDRRDRDEGRRRPVRRAAQVPHRTTSALRIARISTTTTSRSAWAARCPWRVTRGASTRPGKACSRTLTSRRSDSAPARRLYFNDTQIASFRDRQENAMRGQAKLTYRLPGAKKLSAGICSRPRTTTGTTTRSAASGTGRKPSSSGGSCRSRSPGRHELVHLLQRLRPRVGAEERERPVQDGVHAPPVERLLSEVPRLSVPQSAHNEKGRGQAAGAVRPRSRATTKSAIPRTSSTRSRATTRSGRSASPEPAECAARRLPEQAEGRHARAGSRASRWTTTT